MKWIYELSYDHLKKEITGFNLKPYVADQVFQWLYAKNCQDVERWSNVSIANKRILGEYFDFQLLPVLEAKEDGEGTEKILVGLSDGHRVESVLIPERDHFTFCISTQVGCALGCAFCATGKLGFKRNLTAGEIIAQVLLLENRLQKDKGRINIVLMGMGEPLLNYPHLKQALETITADKWMAISPRRITLSTAGILERLKEFENDFPNIKVSFSLNASDSHLRESLMPISRREKLHDMLHYFRTSQRKRRLTFEYVLLKGINDSVQDAEKVAKMLRGIPCKINLIPYNENNGLEFKTPAKETVDTFSEYMYSRGYAVMVRWSKGRKINSACGQLVAGSKAV